MAEKRAFVVRMEKVASLAGNATRLAQKTGISRRAIGAYLSGESDPSRERLIALANAADVSLLWLATGEGDPRPKERGTQPGAPPAAAGFRTINADDVERELIIAWLCEWWETATADQRPWLREHLRRTVPEFAEWEKKRQEQAAKSTA